MLREIADGALVGILRLRRDFAALRHGSAQDDRLMKCLLATENWPLATCL